MNKEETPSSKMEYPKNQHLFNAIRDITGFTPLESDMRQILIAVEKDNPCSPPDEGAFAEWCSQEGWYYTLMEYNNQWGWRNATGWERSTSKLLKEFEIFKQQTGRETKTTTP